MIKSKYCNREDIECLADTLNNEDSKQEFCYGFFSAISFAYYKNLSKEEKELYCGEIMERVLDTFGQDFLNEFLEEHFGKGE